MVSSSRLASGGLDGETGAQMAEAGPCKSWNKLQRVFS